MAKLVSKTYGDALFETAIESGRLDEYFEEAKGLVEVIKTNGDLIRLMNHPKVSKEDKITVLENCFGNNLSKEMLGLLHLVVTKDRFSQIQEILQTFLVQVKEYKNIGLAKVISPMELTKEQKDRIREKLLETTKYVEFEIEYETDPELIGGLVIRIGDRVVDSSIRTKLQGLSRDLSKIQLKAGE